MKFPPATLEQQRLKCAHHSVPFFECVPHQKVGVSLSVRSGELPIHGLRHPPVGGTTGWYIWTGELGDSSEFFVPLHAEHLLEWCPLIVPYLGMAPGWRFLLSEKHVDVWEDRSLL